MRVSKYKWDACIIGMEKAEGEPLGGVVSTMHFPAFGAFFPYSLDTTGHIDCGGDFGHMDAMGAHYFMVVGNQCPNIIPEFAHGDIIGGCIHAFSADADSLGGVDRSRINAV